MHFILLRRAFGPCLLLASTFVIAQDQTATVEETLVVARPLSKSLAQASTVLEGESLARELDSNIGATLAHQPGIHSAPFGKAVGRPIIHGLSGPRVKIMIDRIDTLDVSVTSGDHAVGVEPFIAERIEVLKGASTLLYGSGAIGGVVNIQTARIPHELPDNNLSGGIEARFDDNTSGNTTVVKLNGGLGQFAWHLDGTLKNGDDYKIPGFAESARLRATEAPTNEAHAKGVLPGSYFDSDSAAIGASYLANWGLVGISVSTLGAEYGLPGGHEEGAADSATPRLQLEQTRTDFELSLENPFGRFTSLNIRVGANDYKHQEIEPDGEIATHFFNKAWESRVELVHETNNWTSIFGWQQSSRQFSALGEEAFIPPVKTTDVGLFWVGERSLQTFDLDLGLRLEHLKHNPEIGLAKSFSTFATSIGAVFPVEDAWQLGLMIDYTSRAPVAEELYSNGPHLVTHTYERGNVGLNNEKALNLSATAQYTGDAWSAMVASYYIQFSDFIFQQATGMEEEGLAVVTYRQNDAVFFGVDVNLGVELAVWGENEIRLNALFDYVHATVDVNGDNHLPRTPPVRFGLGAEARWGSFSGTIDYVRVNGQSNVTDFEWITDAYNDLAVYMEYRWQAAKHTSLKIFLQGKNLTNEEQRIHTSFIKEFAPAPGRTVEIGVRLKF